MTYAQSLEGLPADWRALPFFAGNAAAAVLALVDARVAGGAAVLPPAADLFTAFALTPRAAVKAVILGQDPYPTPGHAHGLAFSYLGGGRLPASLKRILDERDDDVGAPAVRSGDLSGWAREGVLLLNTALTVEAGRAGAHLGLGWEALSRDVLAAVNAGEAPVAFILWGGPARRLGSGLGRGRHLVIENAHPSPLAAGGDFRGSRPFSRANAFLAARGRTPIDWRATAGTA